MQLNKSIKIFTNYFLGPLLFIWLSFSIYRQVMHQPQLEASWIAIQRSFQSYKIIYLVGALLLVPVNWGLESVKWRISLRPVFPISFMQACKAVLSGVSISVTMPNRVGEYLGRMMYLPEGNRLRTISITLVGSLAQLLVTLIAGLFGMFILQHDLLQQLPRLHIWYQFILYGSLALVFLLLLLYFNVSGATAILRRWKRHVYLVEALQHFKKGLLLQLLALSFLRYFVFMIQYIFVFYLFEVHVPVSVIMLVMGVVFIFMAVIPSIALVEVWLRGEILIRLMGLYSANLLGIGFTSVTVWFLNLVLPALAGSLLILNLRIFKKKTGNE